jgi:hypothetical protein
MVNLYEYKNFQIIKDDIKLIKSSIIWYKKDILRNHVSIVKDRMVVSLTDLERKLNLLKRLITNG